MKPKFIFINPKKNHIAVFFASSPFLDNIVLHNLPRTNIGAHEEELYITPSIIVMFLIQLRYFTLDLIRLEKTFLRKLKRCIVELFCHYWIACVAQTKAKVVLCLADNYYLYQRISILDKDRVYYAIQNGTRTLHCTRDTIPVHSKISMTNYFCFGQREIDLFSKQKHLIDNYIPVGSLVGGYYKTHVSSGTAKKKYDICLVSQLTLSMYTRKDTTQEFEDVFGRSLQNSYNIFLEYLEKYMKEMDRSMVVCLRESKENNINEEKIHKDRFTDKCTIVFNDRENFSTYKEVDKSELTISLNSTVLADAFSWGSKVLYTNLLNSEWLEMPEAGISYYNKNDYEGFKNKINELINMDIDNYRKITHKNAKYICNYNPKKPAHEIIRSTILKDIGCSQD
jgi:surface carbohydrate biosynthesis protein